MEETYYVYESTPELIWASLIGAVTTFALFALFFRRRDIRGRLMPFCILSLLHTLIFPLACCFPCHSDCNAMTDRIVAVLGLVHLFSAPVMLLFLLIYAIALAVCSRMNRFVALAAGVFLLNVIIQAFFALCCYGRMFTR
jgi:hypothetical protein